MQSYLDMLEHILTKGRVRPDRTGTGTLGVFGYQLKHDLSTGFPLLTTKRIYTKAVIAELLWLLSGSTNIKPLVDQGVSIWTAWPLKRYNQIYAMLRSFPPISKQQDATLEEFEHAIREEPGFAEQWGDLGPVYGKQWRRWTGGPVHNNTSQPEHIDQISNVMASLRDDPFGRRHIVNAWNPADIAEMTKSGLPPCHCLFQFNVRQMTTRERMKVYHGEITGTQSVSFEDAEPDITRVLDQAGVPEYYLDCQLYQRSCDVFLGVPFNIASYCLLIHMMAQQLGYAPGEFTHTFGDLHIYSNHMDQVKEQLTRTPGTLPILKLRKADDLFSYRPEDFVFEGYEPQATIKAPVAV